MKIYVKRFKVNNTYYIIEIHYLRDNIKKETPSKILFDVAKSIVLPNRTKTNQKYNSIKIDEVCNFNDIFLLPFRILMKSKSLDSHIQDVVLVSLRVIVECNTIQIKASWNCVFMCLDQITLNSKTSKKLTKCQLHEDHSIQSLNFKLNLGQSFSFSDKQISYSSSSAFESSSTSLVSSLSTIESSSCSSSSESSAPFSSFKPNHRYNSYRIRLASLLEIFNIFLKLANTTASVIENGSFDFIKCLTNYIQYSFGVNVYKPSEYTVDCVFIIFELANVIIL